MMSELVISFSSVQFSSVAQLCPALCDPWTAAYQASLFITNSQSLLKLTSIELVMPSNHLVLCHPILLPPSIFPNIGVFSNESVLCIRWPKYWSFSFSISPSNEYSGLISFRRDWLHLLAVQGIPQFKSISSSVLSFLYSLTLTSIYDYWKNHSFDWQSIFVGKVMSLFRFVIAFLPRSKHLLISWLQSLSTVIVEPKKRKFVSFYFFSSYLSWNDGTECHDLSFLNVEFQVIFFTLLFHTHQEALQFLFTFCY